MLRTADICCLNSGYIVPAEPSRHHLACTEAIRCGPAMPLVLPQGPAQHRVLLGGVDEVVQLGVDAEVDADSASSMNSAIDAAYPCNALRPAIGPISPAAKKPASGMPPSSPSIVDAS
jgi:hypothetical protein